ncbi:MAG: hypothetical protein LBE35_03085 [Clostridiales bacterium]|jgi:hypothetical protein|nr:hypothetical protein [Clostridiales bacterium]
MAERFAVVVGFIGLFVLIVLLVGALGIMALTVVVVLGFAITIHRIEKNKCRCNCQDGARGDSRFRGNDGNASGHFGEMQAEGRRT